MHFNGRPSENKVIVPIPTLPIPTVTIPTIHIRQNASEKAQLTLTLTLALTLTLTHCITHLEMSE